MNADLKQAAWLFAAKRHNGQKYPAAPEDLPYLAHLGAVVLEVTQALLHEPQKEPDLAVLCAILHDVLEDTNTASSELLALFGPKVTQGVQALSKNSAISDKKLAMEDSLTRIKQCPTEVWLVKLSDRIANLGKYPSPRWGAEKIIRYADEGELILNALGAASPYLSARLSNRIEAWRSGNF